MNEIATMRGPARAKADDPAAGVRVGDYVGRPAAEAARAVRRAGLRPGLDRSFGCEPELTGLVIAQEPAHGAQVSRNGMVTLYVAAPGAAAERGSDHERYAVDETAEEAPAGLDVTDGVAAGRTRRKRGLARGREQPRFGPPPEPTVRAVEDHVSDVRAPVYMRAAKQDERPHPEAAPTWAPDSAEALAGREYEPSYETLLAEQVFAGRAGDPAAWAGDYLGRGASSRWRAALAWLRRRPALATSVCAMLAVWVAVAFAGALARPRADRAHATVPSFIRARRGAPEPSGAAETRERAAAARGDHLGRATHIAQPDRRQASQAQIAQTAASSDPSGVPSEPEVPPAAAPAAEPSGSPARAPAQSGGGPFSP